MATARKARAAATQSGSGAQPQTVAGRDVDYSPELEEEIRSRAYEIYEAHGYEEGRALEDWLQAEAEIRARRGNCAA